MVRALNRRQFLQATLAGAAGCAFRAARPPSLAEAPPTTPWPEADEILRATRRPQFPEAIFPVEKFGARGDGRADESPAFAAAIAACSAAGGGRVTVPTGEFSVGAIALASGVDLHLAAGALLRFSGDARKYPHVLTRFEGLECWNRSPMIYARGAHDLAVSGAGILDASLTAEWNRGRDREFLERMLALPPAERDVTGRLRVAFVETHDCERVLFSGITLTGSRFWQLHPTLCRDVTVEGVTTTAQPFGTTDGIDPESCQRVVIRHSTLASGDDNIALKSGRDADGRRVNVPCRDVVILGCQAEGPNAFLACGSEQSGGIENVYAFDNRTYGRGVGALLRVKSNSRRGGYTRNVHIDTFAGRGFSDAILEVNLRYGDQTGAFPPHVDGLYLSHIQADGSPFAVDLRGLPQSPVGAVRIRDSRFTDIGTPRYRIQNAPDVKWENTIVEGHFPFRNLSKMQAP